MIIPTLAVSWASSTLIIQDGGEDRGIQDRLKHEVIFRFHRVREHTELEGVHQDLSPGPEHETPRHYMPPLDTL